MKKKAKKTTGKKVTDFKNFLYLTWQYLQLPEPTKVQYDIADYIQQKDLNKGMVQAFRQVGKTYISAAYVVWRLYMDPNIKIKIISKAESFAKQITFHIQRVMAQPLTKHLLPQRGDRSSTLAFDVHGIEAVKDPSVVAVGIEGQITGTRADLIVVDDIEISNNCSTADQREKLLDRTSEFIYVLKPEGQILYLGTPHSDDSIYTRLPEKGYDIKVWPFEVPEDMTFYEGRMTPFVKEFCDKHDPETILEQERWQPIEREKRMAEGPSKFRLQNMLDTTLSDADKRPLKLNDLIVMDCDPDVAPEKLVWAKDPSVAYDSDDLPNIGLVGDRYHKPWQQLGDWVPYTGCVMAIDPSGRGADETGYAVVKFLNGYLYVVACGGLKGGFESDTLETLADIAKEHKAKAVIIEANFGDGTWTELFRPVLYRKHNCAIEEVKHSKRKELRIIDTLEPVISQHKVVFNKDVIVDDYHRTTDEKYMLMYQLSRITRDKGSLTHDDRIDVLAIAITYWVEQMAVDVDQQMAKHKASKIDAVLRKFMKLGAKTGDDGKPLTFWKL